MLEMHIIPNYIINLSAMQQGLLANNLKKIISLVDNLRDLGLDQLIKLPKVVVVGSQSAGKSSLLEQIVGIDFLPRGSGVVTRRPLELRLTYDPNIKHAIGKFDQIPNETYTDFNKVRDKINYLTDKVCGNNKNIIDRPIILNISSPSCPTITIVDLPGITSNPVGDQPQNIYEITKDLVMKYVNDPRSIILCVIPANQDISTSEALKLVMDVDKKGERSLGCLTKIDIMNRGDNARNILLNQQVELKYGFVGIKNRNNQDVIDNKPVAKSLEQEKVYFATSPVYSTLPPGTTGTQALTDKITKILYNQIKETMPEIIKEIATKKVQIKNKVAQFGPTVAKTPQQLIDYVWKMIAKFLKVYKNSLEGMRDQDYGEEPFGPKIRKLMNEFYESEYLDRATEQMPDKVIEKAMHDYPGDSIPGFPSIDAFLALLNPMMAKLKAPAMLLIQEIYRQIQNNIHQMIDKLMAKQYPVFIQRFTESILKVLENSKQEAKTMIVQLLDAELDYLYTNDIEYLLGDFKVSEIDRKKYDDRKRSLNPLVYQLRKRLDAYFKIVTRNLRDVIPKQVSYFIIIKGTKAMQFQAYNFIAHSDKLQKWFLEPANVREERERYEKAYETLQNAEKRIRRDPEFGKYVRPQAIDNYIKKSGLKPLFIKSKKEKQIVQKKTTQVSQEQVASASSVKTVQPQIKKGDPPKVTDSKSPGKVVVNNQFITGRTKTQEQQLPQQQSQPQQNQNHQQHHNHHNHHNQNHHNQNHHHQQHHQQQNQQQNPIRQPRNQTDQFDFSAFNDIPSNTPPPRINPNPSQPTLKVNTSPTSTVPEKKNILKDLFGDFKGPSKK